MLRLGRSIMSNSIRRMATSEDVKRVEDILPEFPTGPLTSYRKQASFDWRKLKLTIHDEEVLRYKYDIWNFMKNNDLFHNSPVTFTSLDEIRHTTLKRMKCLKENDFLPFPKILENPKFISAWSEAIFMYDPDTGIKLSLTYTMFSNVVANLGTDKHLTYVAKNNSGEINGCFALTEVAHGSNAKGMMTTATFDLNTKEFVMNSTDFRAAKCWVGCLGQSATHAVVYAKLITSDGVNHGLHTFVIPIRCTKSLRPFPGVIVGDMGEKIGLNGVDNGFLMFNNYRISRDCLLNKLGDVDDNGKYVSPIKDPNKRFGASLGALSGGRVGIGNMATIYLQKAITIALRYSAIRKQFGPDNSDEEFSVIEYQQQQFRLLPYLAGAFAGRIFSDWFSEAHLQFIIDSMTGVNKDEVVAKSMEIHALSSASKPTISWMARDGIQVCREACGGHGYLQATGIGKIRNENDGNCTYEGENSVLIQQTSNWLLGLFKSLEKGEKVNMPFNSGNYLNNYKTILTSKANISNIQQAIHPKTTLDAYKWLVCYMLKLTSDKTEKLLKQGKDTFSTRNDAQSYHAASLSVIYCEHAILDKFYSFTLDVKDENCKEVLLKMASLYGAWSLEKHLGTLYMGGYLNGPMGQMVRDGVIELCGALKPEAIALVDTIAPPDFILNSILGQSDGKVYERIQNSFFSYPGSLSRPEWWRDILKWEGNTNSKL